MAIFTAFLVLTVAAITFAITYTTSLNTLEDVGQKYAVSLATTASVKVIDIFEGPAQQLRAFGDLLKTDGFHFPSEDTDLYGGVLNRTVTALLPLFLSQPNVYSALGITFDDGSIAAVQSLSSTTFGVYQMNYATISNKTAGCCGAYLATGYDSSNNMARVTYKLLNPAYDARAASYVGLKPLFVTAKDGLWFSTGYLDYSLPGVFYFPGIFPARNASQFLGLISASVSVSSMNNFLKSQTLTPNGYTFMIDLARSVTATSHPASFESLSYTSNYYYTPLVANCVTNAGLYNPVDYHNFTIACRTLASDFPYPPLQQVANDDDLMVPQQSLVFKKITSGGDTYYVAAAQTPNSLQPASVSFKLYLLLFIPESDLIGDVVAARTTVIVIVAAVFVVASVIAAGVIHLVLRPLKSVATKMRSTARLRDVADESEMSQLKEVYDLQLAFRRMNNAIGSFTRYVPRDVVKDLMKSGQLCQIQMVEKTCSMLFVDIASFTTMCERVPPEELSRLVKVYFEQMSTIVTNHEGLIDKYIGDCIMAVWGAPFGCENHEVKAALCGLLIDRETRVDPLVGQFDSAGEQLSVRVGVATGSVLAGNMGSNERMSYTVIGDPVNLAARLESMNKQFGTRVMIDENTAAKCQGVFCLRHLLKIAVVGKEAGISVYEVVGLCADIPTETLQRLRDKRGNQSPTDTASSAQMSSAHSATTFDGSRSAASLLDKARALTEPSPVAPEKAQQRAQVYSLAVDQYLGAKFGDCIRTLDNPLLDAHDKSVVRLLALAEEGARMDSAALARFDGVWHSEEK